MGSSSDSSPLRIRLLFVVSLLFVASTTVSASAESLGGKNRQLSEGQLREIQRRSIRASMPVLPRAASPQSGSEKQCSSNLLYCSDDKFRWCCKKSEFCITIEETKGGCLSQDEADSACGNDSIFCYNECCNEDETCEVGGCRKTETTTTKTTKSTTSTSSKTESNTSASSTSSDISVVPTPTNDTGNTPTTVPEDDDTDDNSRGGSGGMTGGAKAGIAVGVLGGVGIGAFAFFFFFKRHRRQDTNRDNMGYDPSYHNMQDKGHGDPQVAELTAHSFRTASAGSDEPMHAPQLYKQPQFQESGYSGSPQTSAVSQAFNMDANSSANGSNPNFQNHDVVAPLPPLSRISTAPRSHPAFGPSVRSSVVSDMTRPPSSVQSAYQSNDRPPSLPTYQSNNRPPSMPAYATSDQPPSIPFPSMTSPITMPSMLSDTSRTPSPRTSPRTSLQPSPRQSYPPSDRQSYQQAYQQAPQNTPTALNFPRRSVNLVPAESAITPSQLRNSTSQLTSPTYPPPPPIPADDEDNDMSGRPNSVATTVEIVSATPVRRVSLRQAGAVRKIDVHTRKGSSDSPLSSSPRSPPNSAARHRGSGGSGGAWIEGTKLEDVPKEQEERVDW